MPDGEMRGVRIAGLICFGILAALLFVMTGWSLFVGGMAGILSSGVCAFGLMLLASAARSRRPSSFWGAIFVGVLVALAPSFLLVREMSVRTGQDWNRWALATLPFAAISGSVFGATRWMAGVIDRILGYSQGAKLH